MNLVDLVDIETLKELWQSFSDAFSIPTAILDLDGRVLIAANWQPICTEFHRANPQSAKRCFESDTALANRLAKGESYNVYRCKNGLVDIAVPIIVNEKHLANFYVGQFFFEKPPWEVFEKQAEVFGFDKEAYKAAFYHVPVFEEEYIKSMMLFLVKQVQVIAQAGENSWRHQENERRLRESQSIAKIGQWELDLVSDTLYWSDEVYKIFEIDQERFGASYEAFLNTIHPEDVDAVNFAYTNSIKTKRPYDIVHRLLMKDGRVKYVRELCRSEFKGDKPLISIGTVQDITGLKQAEQRLRIANEKLKELDQLKLMFIASMSHELRTPLNSIIGFSTVMLEEMTGPLNEKQKNYLRRVKNSGEDLFSLVVDVLDVTKIEANTIETSLETFSLNLLIDEVFKDLKEKAEAKPLQLSSSIIDEVTVFSDRNRLKQCLWNVVSNAIKYTQSGSVTVEVCQLKEDIEIDIKDTGIGIKEENFERIFEAFERLETALSVEAGGSGLGLYLTKKIIEEVLKGHISVKSVLGEGSTFSLLLPSSMYFPNSKS